MANIKNTENWAFETKQLHIGQESPDPASDARAVPIYQTTSYVFRNSDHAAARFGLADAGNIYGRLTNSTQDVLEKRLAALEGGVAALAVASGAAAISYTLQNLAHAGDHIVAAKTIYGGTYNLLEHTLPDYGITTTFVDPDEEGSFEEAVQPNTKAIFIEVLGNPNSNLIDIDKVAKIAHDNAIPLVVDSTFTPPNLIRPIEHGADIVIHSLTKFVGGHGTTLGGAIIDSGKFDWAASGKFASITEPNPSYHGVSFTEAVGPGSIRNEDPCDPAERYRSNSFSVQCVPPAAGIGNTVFESRKTRGKHEESNRIPEEQPEGRKDQPSVSAGKWLQGSV